MQNKNVPETPFLKVLAGFVPGVVAGWYWLENTELAPGHGYLHFAAWGLLFGGCIWLARRFQPVWLAVFFLSGLALTGIKHASLRPVVQLRADTVAFVFYPDDEVMIRSNYGRVTGEAMVIHADSSTSRFRCVVNLRNPLALSDYFTLGRALYCKGSFRLITESAIPGMFDRQQYYLLMGIRYQTWFETGSIIGYADSRGWSWPVRLRRALSAQIQSGLMPKPEVGLWMLFYRSKSVPR